MSCNKWIPSFRITQEHRKNNFCLWQWLNGNAQGAVLERHAVFPGSILLASNCSQFMRTRKLDVVCVYLLTFGGFISYFSLEHPEFNRNFLHPEHLLTRHSTINHPFQPCHSPASVCQDLLLRHCTNTTSPCTLSTAFPNLQNSMSSSAFSLLTQFS